MKTDDEYLRELRNLLESIGPKLGTPISRWPKYANLKKWLVDKTPKLNEINATLSTRIYWVLNDITDFPTCKTCGRQLKSNVSVARGYTVLHCSNSCAQSDPQIKEHKKQTCQCKYGVDYVFQANCVKQKIEDSLVDHYGVKHALASPEVQQKYQATNMRLYGVPQHIVAKSVVEKTKQTNLQNYGTDNPWKLKEIQDKCKQKYLFEGIHFDSMPEIAFFIWLRDNNIEFEYAPNIFFEYECYGKIWKYYPDFSVETRLYEIKGDHFFEDRNPLKKMINPYDKSQNDRYEAKHQCMLVNNVIILTSKDYRKYIDYVENAYGKDFLKQFKTQTMDD